MDANQALISMMECFGQAHWHEALNAAEAQFQIDAEMLRCTVQGETVEGHVDAPLMFISGAWALIFAHQSDGRYGHRVSGRINRVWPNGVDVDADKPMLGDGLAAFATHWPQVSFSRLLYPDLECPDQQISLSVMDDAPSRTSLSGILKRAAVAAADADPVQRLRCAEFLYQALRSDWSSTPSDRIMAGIGKALHRLLLDEVASVREMALILADYVVFMLWCRRAYEHYPALCQHLIDAGLNAHMQHARLAEAAFARGELESGEQHWTIAVEGQNPLRAQRLSQAYDHIGDWNDLRTRIYRQAAGAHLRYAAGSDPDEYRQQKLQKKGLAEPDIATQTKHLTYARELLSRAIALADVRIATDVAAIEQARQVPIGQQTIDPLQRRLFIDEIFWLQSHLEELEGEHEARLQWLIRAADVEWRMVGAPKHFDSRYQADLLQAAAGRERSALEILGWPSFLWPAWEAWQKDRALGDGADAREHRFWKAFMQGVYRGFLANEFDQEKSLAAEPLYAGFIFTREADRLRIQHETHDRLIEGALSAPVLVALQAWAVLWQHAFGDKPRLDTHYWSTVELTSSDVAVLAGIAQERFDAGDSSTALVLWRMAHGTDPLVHPKRGTDAVSSWPLEQVPETWRNEVARLSIVAQDEKRTKLKPAGRRIEVMAACYEDSDTILLRDIGDALRKDGDCWESETVRVMKSAPALLSRLRAHPQPSVREIGVIASLMLLHTLARHHDKRLEPGSQLTDAIAQSGIAVTGWI